MKDWLSYAGLKSLLENSESGVLVGVRVTRVRVSGLGLRLSGFELDLVSLRSGLVVWVGVRVS